MADNEEFEKLKEVIAREKKMIAEISSLANYMKSADVGEQRIIDSQIDMINQRLKKANEEIPPIIGRINLNQFPQLNVPGKNDMQTQTMQMNAISPPATFPIQPPPAEPVARVAPLKSLPEPVSVDTSSDDGGKIYTLKELRPVGLEKVTIKRMKRKEKKAPVVKEREASNYVKTASQMFSKFVEKLLNQKQLDNLERDLIKANLQFTAKGYFSTMLLTTCITFLAGLVIGVFFYFFSITPALPIIIKNTGAASTRALVSLAIVLLTPILTFVIMYMYPGMERGSTEHRINEELPFATIHMSAISGSMIDPSKIFNIILITHEYPYMEKEFKKLINEINLYGYDLVSALRNSAYNTPSKKLSELFNGLATTINSGGYLPEFFDKRSQTLMFENRLEEEKKNRAAETFMDIYISLVIAAPMILMILLMMMKISGLGISMSTQMITVIMVLAVTMINLVFLGFLHLKK